MHTIYTWLICKRKFFFWIFPTHCVNKTCLFTNKFAGSNLSINPLIYISHRRISSCPYITDLFTHILIFLSVHDVLSEKCIVFRETMDLQFTDGIPSERDIQYRGNKARFLYIDANCVSRTIRTWGWNILKCLLINSFRMAY